MTKQEAISVLESINAKTDYFLINDDARAEAIDMAISALQAQDLQSTCNQLATDTISRQAAIGDLHGKDPSQIWDTADIEVWVNTLPSAQPKSCEDVVSRKAAVEEIRRHGVGSFDFEDYTPEQAERFVIKLLQDLPSVTPELCEDAVNRRKLLNDLEELITAWEKYPVMAEQIKGVKTAIGYVKTIPSVTPKRCRLYEKKVESDGKNT